MTLTHTPDLGHALLAAARQHADRPALVTATLSLSYRELAERGAGIAVALIRSGIAAGERVAILSERSATPYVAIYGALLAGCAYVPLNPRFPAERNRLILERSGARALVVDETCATTQAPALGSLEQRRVLTPESPRETAAPRPTALRRARHRLGAEDLLPQPLAAFQARPAPGPDAPAYLLFTSGTTGEPKGVPISHANLASYLEAIHPQVPLGPQDRVLQAVDLTFDLSVHDMMLSWLHGAALYAAPDNGTLLAPRLIAAHELTACLIVPSAGARALDAGLAPPGRMPTLRYSLFAGEALPLAVVERWQAAAPQAAIYNLYGPTEATIHTSGYRYDPQRPPPASVVPIGWPLGSQRMVLAHADGRAPAPGEAAEILLSGPQMTRGYWQAPELDRERFIDRDGQRWYRTGDLGRLDAEHGMLFAGRVDRQMKIRGYRVELQEVEGALRSAGVASQVAVVGWPVVADGGADGLVAFAVAASIDADAVRTALRGTLPAYMVPDAFHCLDALPLNANGKTDYRALMATLRA